MNGIYHFNGANIIMKKRNQNLDIDLSGMMKKNKLRPTRGQAIIPSVLEMFNLFKKAIDCGWFIISE